MRTQLCIIGGGPAGLMLAHMMQRAGVDCMILERSTRAHVLGRIRAGVLEDGSVRMLREAGLAARLDREGFAHGGTFLSAVNRGFRIDFDDLIGRHVTVYGQTEVTHDLYDALDAAGVPVIDAAEGVTLHDVDSDAPFVTWHRDGAEHRVDCTAIAGCDGFRGVSRRTIPDSILREYERVYPFGWLGVLSETPPVSDELIYANHERGFALCSMRNPALSRYYIQVPAEMSVEAWPDAAFWDELKRRIPEDAADRLVTGPAIEKSVAPLRSFVAEPMRWGRLFLAGDAAHIVPPTGAKGLNLAFSDIHYLAPALAAWFNDAEAEGIDRYSDTALDRVWKCERFAWSMTTMLHRFPDQSPFDQRMQEAELAHLESSRAAQRAFAEAYAGLPL